MLQDICPDTKFNRERVREGGRENGERIKEKERIFFRTQKMVGKQSGGAAEEVGTGEEGGNAHVRAGEVVPTRYR